MRSSRHRLAAGGEQERLFAGELLQGRRRDLGLAANAHAQGRPVHVPQPGPGHWVVDVDDREALGGQVVEEFRFGRPVVLDGRMEVEMVQYRGKTCRLKAVAFVDGNPVCEAELMARVVDA